MEIVEVQTRNRAHGRESASSSEHPEKIATTRHTTASGGHREVILNLAINVAAPLAVFYGLRAAGVDQRLALLSGVIPPAVRAVYTAIKRRRIDALALFALSIIAVSIVMSFLTGSPRFLLAKDGWMTALGGLWILATLARTPFYLQAIRSVTSGAIRERAEIAWRQSPAFGHMMRVATAIWGIGLVLDAAVRVAVAYLLPIDSVPLISGLQYVVVFIALEVGSRLYLRRAGAGRHLGTSAREVSA